MADVFFSYRRHDLATAQPLLDALRTAGVDVWHDQSGIPEAASITREIREALASAKALLALYSRAYPKSRACQQEITAAYLAAQAMHESPDRRVLILNPEPDFNHVPHVLAEHQAFRWPGGSKDFAPLAAALRAHLESLHGSLSSAAQPVHSTYYGMVPVEADHFTGRVREMWQLHGLLTADRMGIITGRVGRSIAQVRGLGGNGKSLLAREYAIRFGAAYEGGVFWWNAYGNDDSRGPLGPDARMALREEQIRSFAVQLQIPTERLKPEEVEAALWNHLKTMDLATLWIVDDLPSTLTQSEIEKQWTPQAPRTSTLITTRSAAYAFGRRLDLDVLPDDEGFALLTARRKPDSGAEIEAARQMVGDLGSHPLALEVAGSYLATGIQSFAAYLADLRDFNADAVEFGALLRETLPTGHERSISGTFLKSIRMLEPEGLALLELASILAVEAIPIPLIEKVFARLPEYAETARLSTLRALDQLDSLALCVQSGDAERSVHTLVSRTVRFHVRDEARTASLRSAVAQALAVHFATTWDSRLSNAPAKELVHARHLIADGFHTEHDMLAGIWVARYDDTRGDYSSAFQLLQQIVERSVVLLGDGHPVTLTAMNNFGSVLQALGDVTQARQIHRHALLTALAKLGPDDEATLTAMHNFGGTLSEQGELAHARVIQSHVVTTRRKLLGEDHPDTLVSIGALATTLQELGELAAARALKQHVLDGLKRVRGEDDLDTLTATANLVTVMRLQADHAAARLLQEDLLQATRRLLGETHPDTLTAWNNLVQILHDDGDLDRAQQIQEEVVGKLIEILGPDHSNTVTAKNNLAQILKDKGELTKARRLSQEVLEWRTRVLGGFHSYTTGAAWNLFTLLLRMGETVDAWDLYGEALDWLLEADPSNLTADQREIRDMLMTPGTGA